MDGRIKAIIYVYKLIHNIYIYILINFYLCPRLILFLIVVFYAF